MEKPTRESRGFTIEIVDKRYKGTNGKHVVSGDTLDKVLKKIDTYYKDLSKQ